MQRNRVTADAGSVLVEVLVSFAVITMILPAAAASLRVLPSLLCFREKVQDEIALAQMRRILMLSYRPKVFPEHLEYTYQLRGFSLSEVNGNLIIQPGTQVILAGITAAWFEEEGGIVYVVYERNGKLRKAPLVRA